MMQILCHCTRQSLENGRLVRPCHGRVETGEAEWLGQGEPDAKLCHAHRHNRLDNSSFSLLLFLSFSLSPSFSLAVSIARLHSSSFSVLSGSSTSLPMPPLYIFPTFLFYSQFLLSSLAFAPFHQRHPLRVVSSSSCPLALSPFLSRHRLTPPPPSSNSLLCFFRILLS